MRKKRSTLQREIESLDLASFKERCARSKVNCDGVERTVANKDLVEAEFQALQEEPITPENKKSFIKQTVFLAALGVSSSTGFGISSSKSKKNKKGKHRFKHKRRNRWGSS